MRISIGSVAALAIAALLAGCSTTEYVMSTKQGNMIVSSGKPELDEKTGNYVYKDAEGRKAMIPKADVVQIMER